MIDVSLKKSIKFINLCFVESLIVNLSVFHSLRHIDSKLKKIMKKKKKKLKWVKEIIIIFVLFVQKINPAIEELNDISNLPNFLLTLLCKLVNVLIFLNHKRN